VYASRISSVSLRIVSVLEPQVCAALCQAVGDSAVTAGQVKDLHSRL
jgi:hypothetical protein